jgi:hypothetical protein
MFPARTTSPPNFLTPRRWALESRPLRLDPCPFLCAIFAYLISIISRNCLVSQQFSRNRSIPQEANRVDKAGVMPSVSGKRVDPRVFRRASLEFPAENAIFGSCDADSRTRDVVHIPRPVKLMHKPRISGLRAFLPGDLRRSTLVLLHLEQGCLKFRIVRICS